MKNSPVLLFLMIVLYSFGALTHEFSIDLYNILGVVVLIFVGYNLKKTMPHRTFRVLLYTIISVVYGLLSAFMLEVGEVSIERGFTTSNVVTIYIRVLAIVLGTYILLTIKDKKK